MINAKLKLKILSVIALLVFGCAGSMSTLSNDIEIQRVIELDGHKKDDLYINSMEWLSRTFKESKSVVDYQDKDAGKIIGNGAVSHIYALIVNGYVLFSVKLEVKDGRSRITLSNFKAKIVGSSGPPVTRQIMESEFSAAKPKLIALIDDYEEYINSSSNKNDEW